MWPKRPNVQLKRINTPPSAPPRGTPQHHLVTTTCCAYCTVDTYRFPRSWTSPPKTITHNTTKRPIRKHSTTHSTETPTILPTVHARWKRNWQRSSGPLWTKPSRSTQNNYPSPHRMQIAPGDGDQTLRQIVCAEGCLTPTLCLTNWT